MAEPNITELVTTTLRNRQREIADNVSNGNALLSRLNAKGNVSLTDGGRTIVQPLEYAENATFQYYSGYESLDISPSQVIDAAEYSWKQASVAVTWSGLEIRIQNAGREQQIDLLAARMRNAEKTMKNNLSTGVYSDGTGSGGKQVTGLQSQIADAPSTGTVGGINRATYSFWRNQSSGDVASVDTSSALLDSEMRDMWVECTRGNDKPDLIVADQTLFNLFWSGLQAIQRVMPTDEAIKGFNSLKFVNADVVYDGDSGLPSNHMYFLNTDYLFWRPHTGTNMTPLENRAAINQDANVVPMVWAGNLTMSNASLQGVIYT